ncbi:MAG: CDP-alcohol phosphatidyltransferase family protein [Methanobacteriaceae archaeon]|jgi:archaetidylinositol phosphate synthase|nr:CDP-alcohol phosphatidyltransferase family protein [Methanobacteriaceae archaeon]
MLENLRPLLTKILEPIAKRLNINPNLLTAISPFIALIAAYCFSTHQLIAATIFILLSGFLDVADGAVARYHNRTSKFGAFFDSTMDRFSDAILIIGIIFGGYCNWLLGILLIHSAITVSYVKARAESQGIECNVGIAERAVRLIILMAGAVISAIYASPIIFTYFLIILMILSYFTVGQRVYHVYNQLKQKGNQ